jgi:hypothetical protein
MLSFLRWKRVGETYIGAEELASQIGDLMAKRKIKQQLAMNT